MAAANKVIAGDFEGWLVVSSPADKEVRLSDPSGQGPAETTRLPLDKTTVASYETVSATKQKNVGGALGLAAAGAFVLGPLGLLAGMAAGDTGIYTLSLELRDGRRCLIEIDDTVYKALMAKIF